MNRLEAKGRWTRAMGLALEGGGQPINPSKMLGLMPRFVAFIKSHVFEPRNLAWGCN